MKSYLRYFFSRDNLYIALGLFLSVFAFTTVLLPYGVNVGGFAGLAQLLRDLTGVPFSITNMLLNIPLFLWAWRHKGWAFIIRSLVVCMVFSFLLEQSFFAFIPVQSVPLWVSAVIASVLAGCGFGMILKGRASTGGSDIFGLLIMEIFPKLSAGVSMWLVNGLIVASTMIMYGPKLFVISVITMSIVNLSINLTYYSFSEAYDRFCTTANRVWGKASAFLKKPTYDSAKIRDAHNDANPRDVNVGDMIRLEIEKKLVTVKIMKIDSVQS